MTKKKASQLVINTEAFATKLALRAGGFAFDIVNNIILMNALLFYLEAVIFQAYHVLFYITYLLFLRSVFSYLFEPYSFISTIITNHDNL